MSGTIGLINTVQQPTAAPAVPNPAVPSATTITGGPASPANMTPVNVASVSAPAPVAARTITEPETVAGQMNKLLSTDSPYLQSARNRGMETANGRGLINSSLAAGTSERAAIDAAAPIAQQDANTYATAGQSAQNANQDLGLTGYKSLLESAQANENFGYTTKANDQNIKANTDLQNSRLKSEAALQTQSEAAQIARQTQSEKSTLAQQTQQQQANLTLQTQQQQAQAQLQTQLKQMDVNLDLQKLDATARDALTTATAPIIQQVQSEISQIQRVPNEQMSVEDKAKAIDAQNAYLKANLQTISSLYGYKLTWPATNSAQQTLSNQTAADAARQAQDAAAAAQAAADRVSSANNAPFDGGG